MIIGFLILGIFIGLIGLDIDILKILGKDNLLMLMFILGGNLSCVFLWLFFFIF